MRISSTSLEGWVGENRKRDFPTRVPGMSEGEYWIFRMLYYLDVECRDKSPRIHAGHMYGGNGSFQKDFTRAISYIQAGKLYSPECAGAFLNFMSFSPVYVFTDLEPFQHATGSCRQIHTDTSIQTKLF